MLERIPKTDDVTMHVDRSTADPTSKTTMNEAMAPSDVMKNAEPMTLAKATRRREEPDGSENKWRKLPFVRLDIDRNVTKIKRAS